MRVITREKSGCFTALPRGDVRMRDGASERALLSGASPAMAPRAKERSEPPTITPTMPHQPMNHGGPSLHVRRDWHNMRLGSLPHRGPAQHQRQDDQHGPNQRHTETPPPGGRKGPGDKCRPLFQRSDSRGVSAAATTPMGRGTKHRRREDCLASRKREHNRFVGVSTPKSCMWCGSTNPLGLQFRTGACRSHLRRHALTSSPFGSGQSADPRTT